MSSRSFVLALVLSVGSSAWAHANTMRVHFIDVGQGDAALVEFPCGTMLIDTGGEATTWKKGKLRKVYGGSNAAIGYLQGFFNSRPATDRRLDLLVLTHPHIDHTNGVPQILRSFRPRNIVDNNQDTGSGLSEQQAAIAFAEDNQDVERWYVLEDGIDKKGLTNAIIDPINCDPVDPRIRVLWGQAKNGGGWHKKEFENGNNHSVAVRIDYGKASILFTGDLEESENGKKAGIERLIEKYEGTDVLDVDVYQVGHHGSGNGNTKRPAEAMSPEIAVPSHGPDCEVRDKWAARAYGHPRKETIQELLACRRGGGQPCLSERAEPKGAQVFNGKLDRWETTVITSSIYSTGWDGTIVLEAKPSGEWSVASMSSPDECLYEN